MELTFDTKLAANYTSASQKARVLTEQWVDNSIFCPNCGYLDLERHKNNQIARDFYCKNCREDYELKSKKNTIGSKILDGAYHTMIRRLSSGDNPNFFFLNYDVLKWEVINFCVIPKHFFVPEMIEKRKPLSSTARRANYVGCNILLKQIPQTGKIFFVKNRQVEPKEKVLTEWKRTLFLREEKEVSAKGWLLDIMRSVEKLGKREFMLDDIYASESELQKLHPDNRHVRDKIRQQLQILRDKGYLDFTARGRYQLTN